MIRISGKICASHSFFLFILYDYTDIYTTHILYISVYATGKSIEHDTVKPKVHLTFLTLSEVRILSIICNSEEKYMHSFRIVS